MGSKIKITHKMIEKVDSYNLVKYLSFETVNDSKTLKNPENIKIAKDTYLRITDEMDNSVIVVMEGKQFLPAENISNRIFYGKVLSNKEFYLDDTIEYDENNDEELLGDECIGLFTGTHFEAIDLQGVDSAGVELMNCMFLDCKELKEINFANIDTSSCIDMECMFSGCTSLEELYLYSFDTREVGSMNFMFRGCESLTSLDLKAFVTDNLKFMEGMFDGCINLEHIDLSSINTSDTKSMNFMFEGCESLKELDLSNFRIVRHLDTYMDEDGEVYYKDDIPDNWNLPSMEDMFTDCNAVLLNREKTDENILQAYDNREIYEEDDDEEE